MLEAARRFATVVVAIHFLLLVIVIGVVLFATYHIYSAARNHAVDEAARRQMLLARQTSAGIESYYKSIIADLVVLERNEEAATQPASAPGVSPPGAGPPPRPPGTQPRRPRPDRPGFDPRGRFDMQTLAARAIPVNPVMTGLMWRMLQNRATMLFVYDPAHVSAAGPARDSLGVQPQLCFPPRMIAAARQLASTNAEFLAGVTKEPAVSSYVAATEHTADGHLIAVPATGGVQFGDRILVAFVPLHAIKTEFFDGLNAEGNLNAALLDRSGTAMIALESDFVGHNVVTEMTGPDPSLKQVADRHILEGVSGSWTAWESTRTGDVYLPARVFAAEPVDLPGRKWTILVMAPLSEVDASIRPLFRGALFWAIFLSISITLIFASTAYQLIRSRVRLERARREMLTHELEQARGIQLAWLPDGTVPPPGLDVAATNIPASHISGDFYNWFVLPAPAGAARKIAVCIGDVTGHGMSAAFLMATTQLLIRNTMQRVQDPGECLTEVNRQLCTQAFRGQFVTLLLLVIDPAAHTLELATAGHPGPLLAAGDGTREGVDFHPMNIEPQYLLGVVDDATYPTQRFALAPGATLLLYTDGLIEAAPPQGPQFGAERTLQTLRGGFDSLQSVLDTLVSAVRTHTRSAELSDDVTLVALRLASHSK